MGMKVKDVVGAFEFSGECAAVDVLVMMADGIKAFEVASEELEGSQYEDGFEIDNETASEMARFWLSGERVS